MKTPLLVFSLCCFIHGFSQNANLNKIYQKIQEYYQRNYSDLERIEHIHRNALGYDTSRSILAFVNLSHLQKDAFAIMPVVDNDSVGNGMVFLNGDHFIIDQRNARKIMVKKKELDGTIYYRLAFVPHFHLNDMQHAFGDIVTATQKSDALYLLTRKYMLVIDTANYSITRIISTNTFEGRTQYNEYRFSYKKPDESDLYRQILVLVDQSQHFPATSFKQMEEERPSICRFEGTKFPFTGLLSFNAGLFDSARLAGKYLLLDFFYLECLPCHKMTKAIINWMPSMDTTKIQLMGINPKNDKPAMIGFAAQKGLNYPVIIGSTAKDIIKYYRVNTYPTLFLVTPDGTIVTIHEGMSKNFLRKAEKIIRGF